MVSWIISLFVKQKPECDHLYWPVMVGQKPIGQRCSLCGRFNSIEDVFGSYDKRERNL